MKRVDIKHVYALLAAVALSCSVGLTRQPDAFDACAQTKDPAARLACFDRAAAARHPVGSAPMPNTATTASTAVPESGPAAPSASPAAAPASTSASNRDVGLDALQLRRERRERGEPEPPPPSPIVARIVRVIPREPLISAFELDNGQVWEQSESMRFSASPAEKVTIRYGVLGAFFLKNADGAEVRVHRVK